MIGIYVLVVGLVVLIVLGIMAHNSPEGWEDAQGFHYGRKADYIDRDYRP